MPQKLSPAMIAALIHFGRADENGWAQPKWVTKRTMAALDKRRFIYLRQVEAHSRRFFSEIGDGFHWQSAWQIKRYRLTTDGRQALDAALAAKRQTPKKRPNKTPVNAESTP